MGSEQSALTDSGSPRLLFVGLDFHVRTNSSTFFVELLSRVFQVRVVSFDPNLSFDVASLLEERVEVVCLWQLDYLAPIFAMRGFRTIVVPMYDGSSILPDRHWLQMQGCRFINFSRFLHDRITALGLDSIPVRYYPDPRGVKQVDDFGSRRLFFWQRAPATLLNIENILRLFSSKVDSIHIHAAADDGRDGVIHIPAGAPPVTLSRWVGSQNEYLSALDRSNIFVAPRLSEGIGQAFLEAMARGMAVVAYALPTHTDYLQHRHNGILFNKDCDEIDLGSDNAGLEQIAHNARRSVEEGSEIWQAQVVRVVDAIWGAPVPPRRPRTPRDDGNLIGAYRAGVEVYSAYLNSPILPAAS